MKRVSFQKTLLTWYQKNARHDLPWRKTKDPYAIWISEVLLQQTQVKQAIPYYHRFLKRFPTVKALARAPLTRVLEAFSGLGYYSRAKHLHRAAQMVMKIYGGHLPSREEELMKLPGIGRYSAGAIASIAYGQPVPALDGNVTRVLCRYFGIQEDPQHPKVQKELWKKAASLIPRKGAGTFNQALMEMGALVCTPRDPQCSRCPLQKGCRALSLRLTDKIPLPRRAALRKEIRYVCGIVERNGDLLLARRPLSGLLPGLWEFPGGEKEAGSSDKKSLRILLKKRLGIEVVPGALRMGIDQTLTHRFLKIRALRCSLKEGHLRPRWYLEARWFPKRSLSRLPLTAGMLRLAKQL